MLLWAVSLLGGTEELLLGVAFCEFMSELVLLVAELVAGGVCVLLTLDWLPWL